MVRTRPGIRYEHRHHAPRQAPCPRCGTPGTRKQQLTRTVRGIAYHTILLVKVTTGEYRARCGCCTTFRTQVEGIAPKAQYTDAVREAVLDRLLDDHLSLERVRACLRRDFLLELSPGFLYDCLRWKARQLDLAAYRQWAVHAFSGTLCLDELHLGRFTLLLATDPIQDFPVAFALVSRNDHEHMARFLRHLRGHGLMPRIVVTDGSGLYPALLAEVWPAAAHQLCVFHVLRDINEKVLAAVKRLRRRQARLGNRGRKRRPGRPRKANRRRPPTAKEKAHFVFKHRHLIVRRPGSLSARERLDLRLMLAYLPGLAVLRRFVDQVHLLFTPAQTGDQARRRLEAVHSDGAFAAVPELAAVLAGLTAERFAKVVVFLGSPAGGRVRTNNHVERMNRLLRHYEKARYSWRTPRGVVRFVVLAVERQWRCRVEASGPQVFRPGGRSAGAAKGTLASGPLPQTDQPSSGARVA